MRNETNEEWPTMGGFERRSDTFIRLTTAYCYLIADRKQVFPKSLKIKVLQNDGVHRAGEPLDGSSLAKLRDKGNGPATVSHSEDVT